MRTLMGMSHQSLCFMVKLKKIKREKTKLASSKGVLELF